MHRTAPRGYIGLIGLLVAVLLIGFFVWRSDLFTSADADERATKIERDLNAVDAAEHAKRTIEDNYARQRQNAE